MSLDREQLSNALPAYDIGEELGQGGMGVVVSGSPAWPPKSRITAAA